MGRHILKESKEMISGILNLGKSLGYVVKEEFPVEKKPGNLPAVDAAWLSNEDQDFPLMIFEIESKVTSSIANNPVKVFGQPNENFEKPLFFFHIFLEGTKESLKIENLQRLFGLYNYRTYDLTKDDNVTRLIIDIISQHRRLYRKLDLGNLIGTFDHEAWRYANIEKILISIEAHRFTANYLETYASFSFHNPDFIKHYLRFLDLHVHSHPKKNIPQEYDAYWGNMWSDPIHYGILIYSFPDRQAEYLQQLRNWQERSTYLTMIGPHFGLSRDYDEFVLGLAPPFWAFLAALMKKYPEGVRYIADQCQGILEALKEYAPRISFFTAIWLLHIASAISSNKHFEFASSLINRQGGISEIFLYSPPNTIPLEGENETESDRKWNEELQESPVNVPDMEEFKSKLHSVLDQSNSKEENILFLAFEVLLDPGIHASWAQRIDTILAY